MTFLTDRRRTRKAASAAKTIKKPPTRRARTAERKAGRARKSGGAGASDTAATHLATLEEAVRAKRAAFHAKTASVPRMRRKAAALRLLADQLAGNRLSMRPAAALRRRAQQIDQEVSRIIEGVDQREYEAKAERYLELARWNAAQESEQQQGTMRRCRRSSLLASPLASCFAAPIDDDDDDDDDGSATLATSAASGATHPQHGALTRRSQRKEKVANNQQQTDLGCVRPSHVSAAAAEGRGGAGGYTGSAADVADADWCERNRRLLREYLAEFDGACPPMDITSRDVCPSPACGVPLRLSVNGALLICPRCKLGYPYMDTTTASMSYGDDIEFSAPSYKKVHHFEDWLKKFQAKGSKVVDRCVLDAVMQWHAQHGYTASAEITRVSIRQALRALALHDNYDYDMQIFCRITNTPPPYMTPEQEEVCRLMFFAIQAPFAKWKEIIEPARTNFLSYSYVLYKFCQLLGWTQYLHYFNLLKGRDKLQKQEAIWEGICGELRWPFIKVAPIPPRATAPPHPSPPPLH